jgi:hypothetical protein
LSCSSTIFCRSAANSEFEIAGFWQALAATKAASSKDSEMGLIARNYTQQPEFSADKFFVVFAFFMVNFSALHE